MKPSTRNVLRIVAIVRLLIRRRRVDPAHNAYERMSEYSTCTLKIFRRDRRQNHSGIDGGYPFSENHRKTHWSFAAKVRRAGAKLQYLYYPRKRSAILLQHLSNKSREAADGRRRIVKRSNCKYDSQQQNIISRRTQKVSKNRRGTLPEKATSSNTYSYVTLEDSTE